MSLQTFEEGVDYNIADSTAVASTTTETALYTQAPTIPAKYLNRERLMRLRAIGKYSTTGTPTMIFGLRFGTATGGVLLCKTAACTTPSGVTNAMWEVDILIQTRSSGAAGTIMANGVARVHSAVAGTAGSATGEGLVTPMTNGGVVTPAVATVDLTVDTALTLTLTWSANSASNTATLLHHVLESLN